MKCKQCNNEEFTRDIFGMVYWCDNCGTIKTGEIWHTPKSSAITALKLLRENIKDMLPAQSGSWMQERILKLINEMIGEQDE